MSENPEPPDAHEPANLDKVALTSALDAAVELLRRPPAPEAVRFKIQTNPKDQNGSALIVTYIDSRFCSDRLNIVAPGLWSDSYVATPHPAGGEQVAAVLCRVKLTVPTEHGDLEVIHTDVGTSKSLKSDMDMKALYSDAFKRACVKFGIGACIYAAPKQYLKAAEMGGTWEKPKLTGANENALRATYTRWLATVETVFGKPLSHGDAAEGAQGDVDAEGERDEAPTSSGLPFGVAASDALTTQMGRGLAYLLGDDLEAAGELHRLLLEKCEGYMPAAVAIALGLAAGAVKAQAEHAALDDEAAHAAGVLSDATPGDEPGAESPVPDVPAEAPAAAENTTTGGTP